MKSKIILLFVSLGLTILLSGCASSLSGSVYSRSDARKVQNVQVGTVESVKPVKIEGTKSGIGTAAGGVAGGVLGSTVGEGSGSKIGAVVGALGGAAAGSAIEEGVTRKDGIEIIVKLDSGKTIAVVQAADVTFSKGEKVNLIKRNSTIRVQKQ